MRGVWSVLILLGFCQFCASWGSLAIVAVQVEMRSGLEISTAQIAALVWSFSFAIALGAPLAQIFFGHWQRRAVLAASLFLLGVAAVLMGFAQSWEHTMVARILMALGAASVMPTASVIAASMVEETERPAALSMVFGGLTASLVIALPISSFVAEHFGWRTAWFVAGTAAFVAAVGVLVGVKSVVRGTKASWSAMRDVLKNPRNTTTIATTALLICGGFTTYSMIAFWFVEVGNAPRSALSLALLASGVASMFGNAASSQTIKLVGREGAIVAGLAFTVLCFSILWAFPQVHVLSYPAFITFGVGWSLCLAPLQARLIDTAGEKAQLALALNATAFFGGQGLGAGIGGGVYEVFGPQSLPLASVIMLSFTTMMFWLSLKLQSVRET